MTVGDAGPAERRIVRPKGRRSAVAPVIQGAGIELNF